MNRKWTENNSLKPTSTLMIMCADSKYYLKNYYGKNDIISPLKNKVPRIRTDNFLILCRKFATQFWYTFTYRDILMNGRI